VESLALLGRQLTSLWQHMLVHMLTSGIMGCDQAHAHDVACKWLEDEADQLCASIYPGRPKMT
jgi:hypothetical protein